MNQRLKIIMLSFIEDFKEYLYLHMMIIHQNHLFHLVGNMVVVVRWASEVDKVFVAALFEVFVVVSFEAFVEDMLQNERNNNDLL